VAVPNVHSSRSCFLVATINDGRYTLQRVSSIVDQIAVTAPGGRLTTGWSRWVQGIILGVKSVFGRMLLLVSQCRNLLKDEITLNRILREVQRAMVGFARQYQLIGTAQHVGARQVKWGEGA